MTEITHRLWEDLTEAAIDSVVTSLIDGLVRKRTRQNAGVLLGTREIGQSWESSDKGVQGTNVVVDKAVMKIGENISALITAYKKDMGAYLAKRNAMIRNRWPDCPSVEDQRTNQNTFIEQEEISMALHSSMQEDHQNIRELAMVIKQFSKQLLTKKRGKEHTVLKVGVQALLDLAGDMERDGQAVRFGTLRDDVPTKVEITKGEKPKSIPKCWNETSFKSEEVTHAFGRVVDLMSEFQTHRPYTNWTRAAANYRAFLETNAPPTTSSMASEWAEIAKTWMTYYQVAGSDRMFINTDPSA